MSPRAGARRQASVQITPEFENMSAPPWLTAGQTGGGASDTGTVAVIAVIVVASGFVWVR